MVDPAQALPDGAEREHLLDALAELVAARGWEHFVCAPILRPRPEYFPDPWTADARGVHRLARRLLRYAGLDELDVAVEIFAEGEVPPGDPLVRSERHQGAAAWFSGIKGCVVQFGANVDHLADPVGVTAAMAHETAHAFRCAHDMMVDDLLTEEQLTDLTTVYLGFGVLTTKATVRHRSGMVGGFVSRYERTMLGYLSPQAMAFLLACQAGVRGEPAGAIAGALEADQARYFKQALRWLNDTVGDLGRRLGIPPCDRWPHADDLADLTAPLSDDGEPEQAESPAAIEPTSAPPRPDVPVLRVPYPRGFAGGVLGLLAALAPGVPAWDQLHPVLGLGVLAIGAALGVRLGRSRPAWECSGCGLKVRRSAARCRGCNGLFVLDLARAEDRLEIDPWAVLHPRREDEAPGDPYRGSHGDLGIHVAQIDGSELPRVGNVMLCSNDLLLARRSEVDALERRLDVVLPRDYADYVTTLGDGVDTDAVHVRTPSEIIGDPEQLDGGHIVIADTEDGDRLVVHPEHPGMVFVVRADASSVESLGDRLDAAIESLAGRPDGALRWFLPATLTKRSSFVTGAALTLEEILAPILEFGPVYLESDEGVHTVLAPSVGGRATLEQGPQGGPQGWRVGLETDRRNLDSAHRLGAALRELGLEDARDLDRVRELTDDRGSRVNDPAGNEPEDFDLLAAWQGGSAEAAELLSRRYYASIRRFFDLRAPAFADDLTQQTFLGAVEARDAFRRDASFKTFLFAIAHRQLLRHLRDSERGPRFWRFTLDPGPATSLSVVAVRQQEHRLLLMALSQLPVDLQIVTELYYWENMRTAAIGEVLGVGQSTVTSRLARARELLAQHISAMSRPGPLRDRLLGDLEAWSRALGPVTAAANAVKRSP